MSGLDGAWSAMEESRAEGWAFDGLTPSASGGWLARGKTLGACRCCGRGKVEYAHGFGATPVSALVSLSKQEKWRTTHPIAPGQVEAGLG